MTWDQLANGDLLRAAELEAFDAMITADKGIFYQQNNRTRRIALVVLSTNYRPSLVDHAARIRLALDRALPGSFERVPIPLDLWPGSGDAKAQRLK